MKIQSGIRITKKFNLPSKSKNFYIKRGIFIKDSSIGIFSFGSNKNEILFKSALREFFLAKNHDNYNFIFKNIIYSYCNPILLTFDIKSCIERKYALNKINQVNELKNSLKGNWKLIESRIKYA